MHFIFSERGEYLDGKTEEVLWWIPDQRQCHRCGNQAGYSPKTAKQTGSENLAKPDLKQYIEAELDKLHSAKIADAQEVLEYLTAVMRGQHTEQVLKLAGDGVQVVEDIDVSAKERLKAAELIGKRYALFSDKMDLGGAVPVVIMGMINLKINPRPRWFAFLK